MSIMMNTLRPKGLLSLDLQFFAINTSTSVGSGAGANATKPNAYYDKLLLELLVQTDFLHKRFAQERPMPKNSGDTVNFRKITKLTPALTPLSEGVTPASLNGQVVAISATTSQYGDWMEFTDIVDVTVIDAVVKEYTIELARMMREKLDTLVREELAAGSNVFYSNGRASRATLVAGDKPTIDDFRKIVLTMKRNFVSPATEGKYAALISPSVAFDLLDDPKFLKAYEIGQNNKPLINGEIADIYGIKFIEVLNPKTFGAGPIVHASIVLGRQAYGITKIAGQDVQTIVKPLGSAGSADPLNQRQTIGTKINAFVAKRLDETKIARLESVPSNQ